VRTLAALLLSSCAAAPAATHGGELAPDVLSQPRCVVGAETVLVVTDMEVPAGSRLQAAYAAVDAQARAALLELVGVHVASLMQDRDTKISEHIVAYVRGALPNVGLVQHGWVQEGQTLRVYGRLAVPREVLQQAVVDAGAPAAVLDGLVARLNGAAK
jgi:hypothetical protein